MTVESTLIEARAVQPGGTAWSRSELVALQITSSFETGRPLGYGGLTGDFDGMGLSFGLLQWNIGAGSLQPLLRAFADQHPANLEADFGDQAASLREMLALPSTAEQLAWARTLNRGGSGTDRFQIVEPWRAAFEKLAADPSFQQVENRFARVRMDAAERIARELHLQTERGLALVFDNVTQNGPGWLGVRNRRQLITDRLRDLESQAGRAPTEREVLGVIAEVVADTVKPRWRTLVLQRRLLIVNGRGRHGSGHRDLEQEFGLSDAPWETATNVATPVAPAPAAAATFVPLPPGPGYYSYSDASRQFATPLVVQALREVGAAWAAHQPAAARIGVGDISLASGEPLPPHRAHRHGVEVDIRPLRGDGREAPVTRLQPEYSAPYTQALVDALRANGKLPVKSILFNDSGVRGVTPWEGHDNHLHVHFGDAPATGR